MTWKWLYRALQTSSVCLPPHRQVIFATAIKKILGTYYECRELDHSRKLGRPVVVDRERVQKLRQNQVQTMGNQCEGKEQEVTQGKQVFIENQMYPVLTTTTIQA